MMTTNALIQRIKPEQDQIAQIHSVLSGFWSNLAAQVSPKIQILVRHAG